MDYSLLRIDYSRLLINILIDLLKPNDLFDFIKSYALLQSDIITLPNVFAITKVPEPL